MIDGSKTSSEVAKELGMNRDAIVKRARRLGICTRKNKFIFNKEEYNEIVNYKNKEIVSKSLIKKVVKYYPLKTTETFYIYESKINNQ